MIHHSYRRFSRAIGGRELSIGGCMVRGRVFLREEEECVGSDGRLYSSSFRVQAAESED